MFGRQQYACPVCGGVGASYVDWPAPLCDDCDCKVYMQPSTNGTIRDPQPPKFKEPSDA